MPESLPVLPGGPIARRPLDFIFVTDCSGSMAGAKIQALNGAIREAAPHMRDVAQDNPNAEILVRAIAFGSAASWHLADRTAIEDFEWVDLGISGCTSMGRAMRLLADALETSQMPERALPPVLVLVSDGHPTDDFGAGLQALMEQPWGKKAVRLAIAIGEDADEEVLQRFIGHQELRPLRAHNAEDLVKYIRWASTAVLQAASAPPSQVNGSTTLHVPLPAVPTPSDANDVW